ncbi:MAG: MlaC/ttg2D family ABC transporter substrate-binding protein [Colwellia sp.]
MKLFTYVLTLGVSCLVSYSSIVFADANENAAQKPQLTNTQNQTPFDVLKNTGDNLFSRIASSQELLKNDPSYMQTIVEEELMPAVDYQYAAYKILGKHLKKTTKLQRTQFVASMRNDLVKTYALALKQYKSQQVVYEESQLPKGKRIVAIKTKIVDVNAPPIDVVFKLRLNKKTGKWKAYDIVVEGISLISSKQAEVAKLISTKGLDNVLLGPCSEKSVGCVNTQRQATAM